MDIDVTRFELVSSNPTKCNASFSWSLDLRVDGNVPEDPIEIAVVFGCNPEGEDGDVILEELEIDELKVGKNTMVIEHEAPPFENIQKYFDGDEVIFPLLVHFKYKSQPFLTLGFPVSISLANGLQLEDIEAIDSPDQLERSVTTKKYWKTLRKNHLNDDADNSKRAAKRDREVSEVENV